MYRIILCLWLPLSAFSQPSTEVYLFSINANGSSITISSPMNISDNEGKYDNQPYFDKNGENLYYVKSIAGNPDIVKYHIPTRKEVQITDTPAGEYSPQVTPDEQYISAVILNDAGYQRLVKYPVDGGDREVVVPEKVIGYYTWWDNITLVHFVLGDTATLEITNLIPMEHRVVTENIGRSIHKIPDTGLVSFIQDGQIKSLNPKSQEILTITEALDGSQDMAWMPDGSIIMGKGTTLRRWTEDQGWSIIVDVRFFNLGDITRIAVDPTMKRLALVVEESN